MTDNNPYAAPAPDNAIPQVDFGLEAVDKKKIDAVVKDAGQFWLAIILCLCCSGIGALIIPVWYLIRLLQWNKFANKYPVLLNPDAPAGSLPAQFRSARWKLILGLAFGGFIFLSLLAYVGVLLFVGIPQ